MKPLLHIYQQVDLDTASVHAATLEEVTYVKVLKNAALENADRAKDAANSVLKFFGRREAFAKPRHKSTAQLVIERSDHWKRAGESSARSKVLLLLAESLSVNVFDIELLSTRLIEEAAAGAGVPEDLLLSQKAERIADYYLQECVKGVREVLKKQGAEEVLLTERLLSERIRDMSPDEKIEIQKALGIKDLSGRTLRDVFVKSGVPLAGIAAVQMSGFGAYLALTTVMHAVFTSLLGITLPFVAYTTATSALSFFTGPFGIILALGVGTLGYFWGQQKIQRSQYAMIVFACVHRAGFRVAIPTSLLPSALGRKLLGDGSNAPVEITHEERQDFASLQDEDSSSQISAKEYRVTEERLQDKIQSERLAQKKIDDLNAKIHSLNLKAAGDNTMQQSMKIQIESLQTSIRMTQRESTAAAAEIQKLQSLVESLKKKAQEAQDRHLKRLDRRKSELASLWAIHYPSISFDAQPLRWAASQDFAARLEIERALRELADADDPVKQSRSKMHATGQHHKGFTIPRDVPCRVFYTARGKNINIVKMCPRKEC